MRKSIISLFFLIFAGFASFSQTSFNGWNILSVTDFAYYPKSDYVPGETHFAPITGFYRTVEARETLIGEYKISAPIGDGFLLKDGNVVFSPACELTPIFVKPKLSISYSPLPFLVFSAGASVGTGWNFFSFSGMKHLDDSGKFKNLSSFKNYFTDLWLGATFQFDTGALIPGDWSHVVLQATYKTTYEQMTGVDDGDVWYWQSRYRVNGLYHSGTVILAYQMPLVLYRAGIMAEWFGYYDANDFGKFAKSFDGDYVEFEISLLTQWKFTQKDLLNVLFTFKNQRSYSTDHDDYFDEILLEKSGTEWLFERIAFSWNHYF